MTADPHTTNSGPGEPLYASLAASTPFPGVSRRRDPLNGPQTGTESFRSSVDLPAPLVVTRHQCPFCRRHTRADRRAVEDHMTRCWRNPALRNCKTCEHHLPATQGESCNPGEWCACGDYPEACDIDAAPAGAAFPISNCPQWTPAT